MTTQAQQPSQLTTLHAWNFFWNPQNRINGLAAYQWSTWGIENKIWTIVCIKHLGQCKLTNGYYVENCVDSFTVEIFRCNGYFSGVCFAAGRRELYVGELWKLGCTLRMVGPPAEVNWNGPWHEGMYEWDVRMEQQLERNGFKLWPRRYSAEYWIFFIFFFPAPSWPLPWKFANYVALLLDGRWITRVWAWHPQQWRLGRAFMTWDSPLQHFARSQSWKFDVDGSGHRLVATLFPRFLHFDCLMIAQ